MILTSTEVNLLKAQIEGYDTRLYKRLKWDEPKRIRLTIEEKDLIEACFLTDNCTNHDRDFVKKLTGR